jgi:tetratricopeptide (TPR) repeat protein
MIERAGRPFLLFLLLSLLGLPSTVAAEDSLATLLNKAHAHTKAIEWHLAVPLYEQATRQAARRFGRDHETTINCRFLVGWAQFRGGNIDKAQPLLEDVVTSCEGKLGKDHLQLAGPLMLLACIHRNRGEYAVAEQHARRSLAIRAAQLPGDSTDVADSQFVLGTVLFKNGKLAQAEPFYRRALATRRAKLAKNAIEIAESLDDLGDLHKEEGHYARALTELQEARRIKEANYGKEHRVVAQSLVRIAQVQSSLNKHAAAETLLERALAIHEKQAIKNKHEHAMTFNNLAHVQVRLRKHAEAAENYRRSLSILQEIYPADHVLIAGTYHEMGWLFQRKGEASKAEPLYQKALAMFEKTKGKRDITVSNVLFNLGDLYLNAGQSAKARPVLVRSLDIRQAALGKDHADVAAVVRLLDRLKAKTAGLAKIGPADATRGKRHALLVGVRDYEHNKLATLQFTENDVTELARLLRPAGYAVTLLCDSEGEKAPQRRPTARNIRAALKELLAGKGKHDTLLVALAGHGLQRSVKEEGKERDESYFCPCDAQLNDSARLISLKQLFEDLDDCGAGVKLLLVDACRNEVGNRGVRNLEADSVPRPPRGIAALFSCASGQRAFETDKLGAKGHGVFFHFVLEGLRGKAKDEEGEVDWASLSRYVCREVSRRVPELIGGGARQTPHEVKNLVGGSPVLVKFER